MIKVQCPHCGVRLTAPDELAGKPGRLSEMRYEIRAFQTLDE